MQVEQHWSEESSEDDEGMTGANLEVPRAADGAPPEAGANSIGISTATAQEDVSRKVDASDPSVGVKQQAPQKGKDAAEQHASHCGDGSDPAVVDTGTGDGEADEASDPGVADAETGDGEVDEAYVMAYVGRHMCPQELQSGVACGGTMTPVGVYGDTYVCNMCDFERSETERIAELARTFQAVMDEAD